LEQNQMGFLNNSGDQKSKKPDYLLDVTDVPKRVRPLFPAPESLWGHNIPEVVQLGLDGKTPQTLRRYSYELCVSQSRSGAGCNPCVTQDPLWALVDQATRFNKKGQRVDFPKKPTHLLPVKEMDTGSIKILKGGNGVYKNMDEWYETQSQGQKDLTRCDWMMSKAGTGKKTQYSAVRQDATPFTPTAEDLAEARRLMELAKKDMAPATGEKFIQMINGDGVPSMSGVAGGGFIGTGGQGGGSGVNTSSLPSQESGFLSSMPAPLTESVPTPVIMPSATPVAVASQANTANTARTNAAGQAHGAFAKWLNEQSEFAGIGIIQSMIPMLKKYNDGSGDYIALAPDKLDALRAAMTQELEALRAAKKA
jgi:hypothetical protein